MSTYREIVYLVNDELKLVSDDSHFTEEHIVYLADKYRALILKQRYSDIRKEIPESNYQTLCIDLEEVTIPDKNICPNGIYMRSTKPVLPMMSIGRRIISSQDIFGGNFNYVSNARFKYVGYTKYPKNLIYGTIGPDNYLYLKSNGPHLHHLKRVKLTGIFEEPSKLMDFQCEDSPQVCSPFDLDYGLEEALIPVVIELIVKELSAFKYTAADTKNDANDNLSDIATFIRNELAKGRRSDLYNTP